MKAAFPARVLLYRRPARRRRRHSGLAQGTLCTASSPFAVAMGERNIASGYNSVALGVSSVADGSGSFAFGQAAATRGITGAEAFGSGLSSKLGNFQRSHYALGTTTGDATFNATTPTALTSDGNSASATNQVNLPNGANTAPALARLAAFAPHSPVLSEVGGLIDSS